MGIDPLRSVAKEMKFMTSNIRQLLGSGHPMLDTVSKYYTQSEGKYIRPMLVLLMSQATALLPQSPRRWSQEREGINTPLTAQNILSDNNPSSPLTARNAEEGERDDSSVLPSQRRLAEITELIHTASLLHDDVIDTSISRRGNPSANISFGNKMAVLAGDFLLGRASVALARLRDPEVTELLATVIANLVEGEFMQLKNTALDERHPVWQEDTVSYYLQKTYLKSASLISKSCRAAALLGQHPAEVVEAAYQYGKNLGLAFQLVDDMLDYTVSGSELGKPAGADLELGLATAPLLFAWRQNKELGTLVGRKFSEPGDVQKVCFHSILAELQVTHSVAGARHGNPKRRHRTNAGISSGLCRHGRKSDFEFSRERGQSRLAGDVYQSDATAQMMRSIGRASVLYFVLGALRRKALHERGVEVISRLSSGFACDVKPGLLCIDLLYSIYQCIDVNLHLDILRHSSRLWYICCRRPSHIGTYPAMIFTSPPHFHMKREG
jgi:hexaprenyl-diphosphate synthase